MTKVSSHSLSAKRFDRLSMAFHWGTLLLLVLAFSLIEGRVLFEKGTYIRGAVKEWHYVTGLLIFLVTLARLNHRLRNAIHPPATPALPGWQMMLTTGMAVAIYGILLVLPVLGMLTVNSLGDPIRLFGMEMPALLAPNEALGEWLQDVHSFVGDTLYVLIGLHAAAALLHHYVLRDDVLVRMMPEPSKTPATVPGE